MIKKVTLDTLDIEEPTIALAKEHLDEEPPEENPPWKSAGRWYRSRLFLISGAVVFVICCAGLLLFFFAGAKKEARHAPSPVQRAATQSTASQSVSPGAGKADLAGPPRFISEKVNDFLIPLRNDSKSDRLLAIDVELEMDSARQQLFKEKIVLIRGGIYQELQGTPADIPKGKEGMEAMRKKIIASVEAILGKGFIKNVWFTKFIVL